MTAAVSANESHRSCVFLNEMGDIEISWDSANDDEMRDIIAKKMAEGVQFFMIKPLLGSWLHRRVQLKTIHDLNNQRIQIKDADIEKMFSAGKVSVFRRDGQTIETSGKAKTPEDAAKGHTVAVKPLVGG